MLIRLKDFVVFSVLVFLFAGCATNSETRTFVYEVRVPNDRFIHEYSGIEMIHGGDSAGGKLKFMPHAENQKYVLWKQSILIHPKPKKARCTFVVDLWEEPIEVFRLPIRGKISLQDWSPWLKPDATDDSKYAAWHAMMRPHKTGNQNNVPTNHFELRYKIEEWRPVQRIPFEN